jgi:hypothetical protein
VLVLGLVVAVGGSWGFFRVGEEPLAALRALLA